MSDYINNALLDASPYKKQKDEAAKLVNKWDKTGLLDGLNEDFEKSGMATLLENQARQLIQEASTTNPTTAKDEEWSGVALPLVRRVFAEIAAQDFVSVQPMNLPSGLVFYLDFKYGTAHQGRTTTESLAGTTGPNSPSGSSAPYGVDGLYGAGQYGYSTSGSNGTYSIILTDVVTASLEDINYDMELSASSAGKLYRVGLNGFSASTGWANRDNLAQRSFVLTTAGASATEFHSVLSAHTNIPADTGTGGSVTGKAGGYLIVSASGASTAISGAATLRFSEQPTEGDRGDFEDRLGNSDDGKTLGIPEVNLQMNSLPIVAKTRKLKAVWTPELAQDLNAYHSVDAEAELTSMLSEYISMEIDLEILDMLVADAVTTDYWSSKVGFDYNSSTKSFENVLVDESYSLPILADQYSVVEAFVINISRISKSISIEIYSLNIEVNSASASIL